MDYPHGHSHHNRRDERPEVYPPPPHVRPPLDPHCNHPPPPPPHIRPAFDPHYNQPPPPVTHVHGPPPPNYPPPPTWPPTAHDLHHAPEAPHPPPPRKDPYPSGSRTVHHVSHEDKPHHQLTPHMPSIVHTHKGPEPLKRKPTVRVFSKAETKYSLTICHGKVILAPSNPSDPFQHWIKDEKFSTKVKDEEGHPGFALINEATGQAMKHSIGATHPVQLIPYNPDRMDESILWTESKDLGDGYRTIRMVNNIRLNVDAFNGDKNHGGVHDGTIIVLWEWKKGENQRWKIVPYYCKSLIKHFKFNNSNF